MDPWLVPGALKVPLPWSQFDANFGANTPRLPLPALSHRTDKEGAMPDQPADPIHYDMKIPPEPKHGDEEDQPAKKHGDKIDTGSGSSDKDAEREEQKKP